MANEFFGADEFATWVLTRDALATVYKLIGPMAAPTVIERLRGGFIKAAAKGLSWESALAAPGPTAAILIPSRYWKVFPSGSTAYSKGLADKFWKVGDVNFFLGTLGGTHPKGVTARHYGVRFDPFGLSNLVSDLPPGPEAPKASKPTAVVATPKLNAGGRPPKEWWSDLWIEMARQLYVGDLKPSKQAIIEKAMQDWLVANGHGASESTVRTAARKLFKALGDDVEA